MKPQRWYLLDGQKLYVYDHPFPHKAIKTTVAPFSDLPYYRLKFELKHAWTA